MQYRIDFLNIEYGKPIETSKGRDYLIRSDKSWNPLSLLRKIALIIKDNPGTTISLAVTIVSNIVFAVFYFVSSSANYTKKGVVYVTKKVVKIVKEYSPVVAGGAIVLSRYFLNTLNWFRKYIIEIILAGIVVSTTLYTEYGEEMSFPILSFWSFIVAISFVYIVSIKRYFDYVQSYFDSVKRYFGH